MTSLTTAAVETIKQLADASVADPIKGIPGVSISVVNRNGHELVKYAAGLKGVSDKVPLTTDNVYWIASCTKLVTSIAAMQLVEQGVLRLDDADQVEQLCPELITIPILKEFKENGDIVLTKKKNRITLRNLLTHTAGMGYTFFHYDLLKWSEIFHFEEFEGNEKDVQLPLTHEPGTKWQYSTSIDWVGNLISRVSGLTLNDYMVKNIFEPLEIHDLSMHPNESIKSRLVPMHQRDNLTGILSQRDHLNTRPLSSNPARAQTAYDSGGAGLYGKPSEYTKILSTLLNDGIYKPTGRRILTAETVNTMFTNQIPEYPDFGRVPIPAANPELTNAIPVLFPQPGYPQGWGLSMFLSLHPTEHGAQAGTGRWCGLANCYWWVDRTSGVAGFICSQILPFADLNVMTLVGGVEATVNQGKQ